MTRSPDKSQNYFCILTTGYQKHLEAAVKTLE